MYKSFPHQAFIIQWFSMATVLWSGAMSYHLYSWFILRKNHDKIRKQQKRYFGGIFLVSFFSAMCVYSKFGPSTTWCWIEYDHETAQVLAFFMWLLVAWGLSITVVIATSKKLGVKKGRADVAETERQIQKKLRIFIFIFIASYMFKIVDRFVTFFRGSPTLWLVVLHATTTPLQGFLNTLAYLGVFDTKNWRWKKPSGAGAEMGIALSDRGCPSQSGGYYEENPLASYRPEVKHFFPGEVNLESYIRDNNSLGPISVSKKNYSIFTTTLNLGEAPSNQVRMCIMNWIVTGHDVYAIGVQECLDLKGLRDLILEYLGGPSKFQMFCNDIGSNNTNLGYHGYIAITVFVRVDDIQKGAVRVMESTTPVLATGADLILTTAQNKGAVGLLLQIHDTSIGFLACHLPSDSKGKCKLPARNKSIERILRELVLATEDSGFDLHLQHDHIVIMGDMNYRTRNAELLAQSGIGPSLLGGVAQAAATEKGVLQNDGRYLQRKFQLFRKRTDPLFPNAKEFTLLMQAKEAARELWETALQTDELRDVMGEGKAFCGFVEELPAFPPSYKYKTGNEGGCGDFTDPVEVLNGFVDPGEMVLDDLGDRMATLSSAALQQISDIVTQNAKVDEISQANMTWLNQQTENTLAVGGKTKDQRRFSNTANLGNAGFAKGDEENQNEKDKKILICVKPADEKEAKSFRPASYTDRILIHSLADKRDKRHVQVYDMCDQVRISDHRPVSLVLSLETNSRVSYAEQEEDEALLGGNETFGQADLSKSRAKSAKKGTFAAVDLSTFNRRKDSNDETVAAVCKYAPVTDTIELYQLNISKIQIFLEPDEDEISNGMEEDGDEEEGMAGFSVDDSSEGPFAFTDRPSSNDTVRGNGTQSGRIQTADAALDSYRKFQGVLSDISSPSRIMNTIQRKKPHEAGGNEEISRRKPFNAVFKKSEPSTRNLMAGQQAGIDVREGTPSLRKARGESEMLDAVGGNKNKKKGKNKKIDKTVDELQIAFPLPSKDPLMAHRKAAEMAEAMNVDMGPNVMNTFKKIAEKSRDASSNQDDPESIGQVTKTYEWFHPDALEDLDYNDLYTPHYDNVPEHHITRSQNNITVRT